MRAVRDWEREEEGETMLSLDEARDTSAGCKFADRCPMVMDKCWVEQPELFRTDEARIARCFLYEDAPVLEGADITPTLMMS